MDHYNRSREYLKSLELKNKLQNVKGKIRLPDVENRFMTSPRTSSDEPIRSNDGLVLPNACLFTVLTGLYKIFLVLWSLFIIIVAIGFVVTSVMIITDDRKEEREIAPIAVPILALVLAIMVVHNIISYCGILTFRLRYMWADLWLHCLGLAAHIVYVILALDVAGPILLVIDVATVVLVYTLIHEIRAANPGHA